MEKHFPENPLYFTFIADFEADNEFNKYNIGNKTTNIHKQNSILNGYYVLSDLEDVLKNGFMNLL